MVDEGSGKTQPAIVVVGSINADLIAYFDEDNRIGNYVFGDGFRFNLGGKGLNQAVNVAAAGLATVLIGRIGDDVFGKKITTDLEQVGVSTEFITVDKDAHTGIGHVRVSAAGEYDTVVVNGANSNLKYQDVDSALSAIGNISYGLMNYEIASNVISSASDEIRKRGGSTVINFSPIAPEVNYVISDADYLVANAQEINALLGEDSDDIHFLAKRIQTQGAKNVIVTLGEQGAFGLDAEGNAHKVPGESAQVVNTIGAGDTFLAAFTAALHSGAVFSTSLEFANYAASLVCSKQESFLTKDELLQAARKFEIGLLSKK